MHLVQIQIKANIFRDKLSNYNNILQLDVLDEYGDKVKYFCDYCVEHVDKEVPDPYYGGDAGFEHVMDLIEDGCRQILAEAKKRLDG